ncbi:MAG: hypothetical protein JSR17_10035 [Proteobacteria bacterium]|nr:hypothetical protein [Pseudomonadota bacterium]
MIRNMADGTANSEFDLKRFNDFTAGLWNFSNIQFLIFYRGLMKAVSPEHHHLLSSIFDINKIKKKDEFISSILARVYQPNGVDVEIIAFQTIINFIKSSADQSAFNKTIVSDLKYLPLALEILSSDINEQKKLEFVKDLISNSIKYKNAQLIQTLENQYPELFKQAKDLLKLDEAQKQLFQELQKNPDPQFYSYMMTQFTGDFGKINHEGGLLTCAATRTRKQAAGKVDGYDFDPTVITDEQLGDYLQILKDAKKPLHEKFVISGTHWMSGEISIDANNQVKILFTDPIGEDIITQADGTKSHAISSFVKENVKTLTSVFNPADCEVFFDLTKRQNSPKGCSAFALDDVMHLYSAEKRFGDGQENKDLFDYLAENTAEKRQVLSIEKDGCELFVNITKLPTSLMRTTQSSALIAPKVTDAGVTPSILGSRSIEEQESAVNKKGETARLSASKHFILDKGSQKTQNMRLKFQLSKLSRFNDEYLKKTSPDQIQRDLEHFSLSTLAQRLEVKHAKKEREATQAGVSHGAKMDPQHRVDMLRKYDREKENIHNPAVSKEIQELQEQKLVTKKPKN